MNTSPIDISTITAAMPAITARRGWTASIGALKHRNYRWYAISLFITTLGGFTHRIAADWMVLQATGSVAFIGVSTALQFAPTLLLGVWGGVLADRFPRRSILLVTMSLQSLLFAALAVLALLGTAQVWQIWAVAVGLGVTGAFDGPARAAFQAEMVGHVHLRDAVSINSTMFQGGALIAPVLAGLTFTVAGPGICIAFTTATWLFGCLAILTLRRAELVPVTKQPRTSGQFAEALRYVRNKPSIFWTILLLSFVATFSLNFGVLIAGAAHSWYNSGASGYGLYTSLIAAGAFAASIMSTRRRTLRLRTIVVAGTIATVLVVSAGIIASEWYFAAALVGIGFWVIMFMTGAESLTQLSSNLAIRGRVMSIYLIVAVGGQALNGVVVGALTQAVGPQLGFVISGAVPLIATLVIGALLWRRVRAVRLQEPEPVTR
ncbi:MAG TPA: MFS transporter [Candidatus Lumbricidophila sp.]|nr:MFS transporter [Candidatus Lumbricidophila sp.]